MHDQDYEVLPSGVHAFDMLASVICTFYTYHYLDLPASAATSKLDLSDWSLAMYGCEAVDGKKTALQSMKPVTSTRQLLNQNLQDSCDTITDLLLPIYQSSGELLS